MSKTLQVRDLPDEVHERLTERAAKEGRSLSELVREVLTESAAQPTLAEMMERIAKRGPLGATMSGAEAVRLGREEREAEIDEWLDQRGQR